MSNCTLCTKTYKCCFCHYNKTQDDEVNGASKDTSRQPVLFVLQGVMTGPQGLKPVINCRSDVSDKLLKASELLCEVIIDAEDPQLCKELQVILDKLNLVITPMLEEQLCPTIVKGYSDSLSTASDEPEISKFPEETTTDEWGQSPFPTSRSDLLQPDVDDPTKKTGNFQCPSCPSLFHHRKHLTAHIRTHPSSASFKCRFCPHSTTNKYKLKGHEMIHTGEKPYSCQQCPRRFRKSQKLLEHNRRHTGEKPFSCQECPYRSVTSHALVQHTRRHKGEKSFKCPSCPSRFVNSGDLRRHERHKHLGVKPFECQHCPYRSVTRGQLRIHEKRGHNQMKPLE